MARYSFPKPKQDESKRSKLQKLLGYIYPSTPQEAAQSMANPIGLGLPIYLTRSPSTLLKIIQARANPEAIVGFSGRIKELAERGGSAAIFPDYPMAVKEGIKDAAIFINPLSKVGAPRDWIKAIMDIKRGADPTKVVKEQISRKSIENPPGEVRLLHELGHVAHGIYDPTMPATPFGEKTMGMEVSAWLPFIKKYPHRAAEAIEPLASYIENIFDRPRYEAAQLAKGLVNSVLGKGAEETSGILSKLGIKESFAEKLTLPKNALEIARERIRMAGLRPHIEMGVEKLRELKDIAPDKIMEILLRLKR